MSFSIEAFDKDLSPQEQEQIVSSALRFGTAAFLQNVSPEGMEKFLTGFGKIREALDKEGEFTEDWQKIEQKLKAAARLSEEGKKEESKKSYLDAMSQVNRLVYRVNAKNRTWEKPPSSKHSRDSGAVRTLPEDQNPGQFFASRTLEAADQAYAEKDFVRANILYSLARDIYAAGDSIQTSEDFVHVTQGITEGRRKQAQSIKADQYVPDIFAQAQRQETLAMNHLASKEYRRATESFLKAAEIYDQATQTILAKLNERSTDF